MEMHANNCVWVSHWEMVKDAESGKTKRVRRARPKVYAGTVYTVWPLPLGQEDDLCPFVGWTRDALQRGKAAKHYGRLAAVFSDKKEMWRFVRWYEDLIDWALEYGHTWRGGSRIQIGWDGQHRGDHVTIDGVDVEWNGPTGAATDTTPFGNLVWARVRGLRRKHTDESMALLDLEQITRLDKYDPYVCVLHAYPRDYGNEGIYATEIVHVYSDRAEKIINGKEAQG